MHDIWNPWHGCVKCSEGCQNCYMYFLDSMRDKDGADIYLTANARYPLSKDRKGRYKIQSGEMISVKKPTSGVRTHGMSCVNAAMSYSIC